MEKASWSKHERHGAFGLVAEPVNYHRHERGQWVFLGELTSYGETQGAYPSSTIDAVDQPVMVRLRELESNPGSVVNDDGWGIFHQCLSSPLHNPSHGTAPRRPNNESWLSDQSQGSKRLSLLHLVVPFRPSCFSLPGGASPSLLQLEIAAAAEGSTSPSASLDPSPRL